MRLHGRELLAQRTNGFGATQQDPSRASGPAPEVAAMPAGPVVVSALDANGIPEPRSRRTSTRGGDLRVGAQLRTAGFRYNFFELYVNLVLSLAAAYRGEEPMRASDTILATPLPSTEAPIPGPRRS